MSTWLKKLAFWRTPSVQLTAIQQDRLARLQALPRAADWEQPFGSARLDIVDVESSGLNLRKDSLIAIGAVSLDRLLLQPTAAFEVVLRQETVSSHENILIHGISGNIQRNGHEPVEALLDFLEFNGKRPLVAYHAFFDEAMLARAMRHYLGFQYQAPWLDLAWLLPALFPEHYGGPVGLDTWLKRFGITVFARHTAISDCLATAQLTRIAIERARKKGIYHAQGLAALENAKRRASRL